MFFVGTSGGPGRGLLAALLLTGVILLGVFLTFGVSRLLSGTLLRGVPSSFTLELPPYRRPRIGQVVVRSVLDRTLFVLGRAAAVAAPAGLLIWLCANVQVGGDSILNWCTGFLDPFARLLGLDGVILMAFLLGFPANEIVIPIIIMAYLSTGSLLEFDSLDALRQLLVDHGWTWLTAVCTMLFSLMHWPCSTTCLTIGKETKSAKWTLLSIAIPTGIGMAVCFLVASAAPAGSVTRERARAPAVSREPICFMSNSSFLLGSKRTIHLPRSGRSSIFYRIAPFSTGVQLKFP